MSVLDYINSLVDEGYSEEDAERCADYLFSDNWDTDYDDEGY